MIIKEPMIAGQMRWRHGRVSGEFYKWESKKNVEFIYLLNYTLASILFRIIGLIFVCLRIATIYSLFLSKM